MNGKLIERDKNCRICNERSGIQIASVDYWDIKTSRLVKCPKCNHIQLDPMLNDAETSKGCFAYFIDESLRVSSSEQQINCVRNFRRGVVFGLSLKRKNISPENVLELGPGSGYFSAGLQFIFPDINVCVMDINNEVLHFNSDHHNYKTIQGNPEHYISALEEKFDLIIARDILEHVTDISATLSNVNRYLISGGYFHFITPNGHEDAWKHYLTEYFTNSPSELLINHVNYFDGKGLKNFLIQKGFTAIDYYTYTFKTTLRGRGWKKKRKLMNIVSTKKNADQIIRECAEKISINKFSKKDILNKWYIQPSAKWITSLYSIYQHSPRIRINPDHNVGHEIFGLFRKKS